MKKVLITIPCYNEELVLEKTALAILTEAKKNLSNYVFKILILDNNSSDNTLSIGKVLMAKYPEVFLCDQVKTPGRGVAIRELWLRTPGYDVYSYMDADLATNLKDLKRLIDEVASSGFDLVTGSRYLDDSDVERNFKREVLSRIYNLLLKLVLRVSFKDAQCGFKAFSNKLVSELFSQTYDSGWFWDTELMILACRKNYRVIEIPVSWREVRDELRRSKVSVWSEVWRNLKNIYYMYKRLKI